MREQTGPFLSEIQLDLANIGMSTTGDRYDSMSRSEMNGDSEGEKEI